MAGNILRNFLFHKYRAFKNGSLYLPAVITTPAVFIMTRRLLTLLPLLAIVIFSACKRDKVPYYGNEFSRGYYPLLVGHYVTYDVDSTIWNSTDGTKRISHSQMRYTVADTFRDAEKRLSYRIDVISRTSDTSTWSISDVYYMTSTASTIETFQNNLRFIRMIFPVTKDAEWTGNSMIDTRDQDLSFYADWHYKYGTPGVPYNNGRASFDNTVTVSEVDETVNDPDTMPLAYASRTFSKATYAYGVGMVYREFTHWVYDYNPSRTVNAREGSSVVMRALDYN